jgi:hypothetical protein
MHLFVLLMLDVSMSGVMCINIYDARF